MTFRDVVKAALRLIICNHQPRKHKVTQVAHFCVVRMVGGAK